MSLKYTSLPSKILSESITTASTSFKLNNINGWDDVALTSADFGSTGYGVFRNSTNSTLELFEFDPATIASASITITRRGLKFSGDLTTEVTANKLAWTKGDTFVDLGTDTPQMLQFIQEYIDAAIVAGGVPSTTTVLGLVKMSTAPADPANPTAVGTNDTRLPTQDENDAMAGGGDLGTPDTGNKFITEEYNASPAGLPVVRTYLNADSPATWTKPAGLKYIIVEAQAAGGGGAGYDTDDTDGPATSGSGGGYCKKLIPASSLGATETVTIGANGNGANSASSPGSGTNASNTTFGSHVTAGGGLGATANSATIPAGGTATGGDINIPGGSGSSLRGSSNRGLESHGGDSFLGRGGYINNSQEIVGSGYGYGGPGGSDSPVSGKPGGPAIVIVTEYYS